MKVVIRKALPEDYELVTKVGHDTFYETWKDVNTPADMAVYLKKAFDPKVILADLENPANTFLLASIDDQVIGYAKIRRDRTYDEFKGESAIEIERIYVFNQYQSQKVGKLLMDECLRISTEENFTWIWLGVNIDNHKAINFYRSYGFTVFGEKGFQLGDAVDTDYLMKRAVRTLY
jgi:ribosomal protein S18 acetylase RimI-like enzyme